jgi:predicted ATPase
MKLAFPDSFEDLIFEQTGRSSMYASMVERNRTQPTAASGISDGHLQMLIVLAALFGGEPGVSRTVFLDEPEISLHPWPLAAMAEAMREATRDANLKVIAATHSPVFISQFERDQLLVAEKVEDKTIMRWLAEIPEVQDLLDEYAAGSIYMGQAIAPQGGQAQFFERSQS